MTALEMAAAIIPEYGFVVLPIAGDTYNTYRVGFATEFLWGAFVQHRFHVIGESSPREWRRQCAFVNKKWPEFIKADALKAEGYEFRRLVTIEPIPLYAAKAIA